MNTRKLLRALRRIGDAVLDDVPSINHGGCAVLAGIVGEHLERLGVPCEVATAGQWESMSAREARPRVKRKSDPRAWDVAGLGRAHLALRFRLGRYTYTWDAERLRRGSLVLGHERYNYVAPSGWGSGLTLAECRAMTQTQRGWNTCFDRADIPLLELIASEEFDTLHASPTEKDQA